MTSLEGTLPLDTVIDDNLDHTWPFSSSRLPCHTHSLQSRNCCVPLITRSFWRTWTHRPYDLRICFTVLLVPFTHLSPVTQNPLVVPPSGRWAETHFPAGIELVQTVALKRRRWVSDESGLNQYIIPVVTVLATGDVTTKSFLDNQSSSSPLCCHRQGTKISKCLKRNLDIFWKCRRNWQARMLPGKNCREHFLHPVNQPVPWETSLPMP